MKILIVTPYFYPELGGLENYAYNISRHLNLMGHSVNVITSGKKSSFEAIDGINIIRLPVFMRASNTPMGLFWKNKIKKYILRNRPDVVVAHTPVPYISDLAVRAAAKKIPTVLTYHNDLVKPEGVGKYLAKLYYILFINKTLRNVDKIISTSEYYTKTSPYLNKYLNKLSVVSPGVDIERFNDKVDKKWLSSFYKKDNIILFVASMKKSHKHKGLYTLLNACAKMKEKGTAFTLIAAGSGDALEDYKKTAEDLDIEKECIFPGRLSDDDLPKYYAGASVLCLPSTTSAEGFGMVIIEAAACGTPAVASNIGGIPFAVVSGETGLLVPPKNPTALADTISATLNNSALLNTLGEAAQKRALTNFSWQNKSVKTEEILAQAVSEYQR